MLKLEIDRLFKNLEILNVVCNYKDEGKDVHAKNARTNAINEIQNLFKTSKYIKSLIIPHF